MRQVRYFNHFHFCLLAFLPRRQCINSQYFKFQLRILRNNWPVFLVITTLRRTRFCSSIFKRLLRIMDCWLLVRQSDNISGLRRPGAKIEKYNGCLVNRYKHYPISLLERKPFQCNDVVKWFVRKTSIAFFRQLNYWKLFNDLFAYVSALD